MIKKIKIKMFVIVVALSFANNCSGESSSRQTPIKLSGEEYWYSFLLGGDALKETKELENGTLTGMYLTRHGYVPFIVSKKDINDPKSKTQGYIYYGNFYAYWLMKDKKRESRERAKRQLKIITGLDFNSKEEWERWAQKNRPYLQFSEKQGLLIVVKPETNQTESQNLR
jgi:hypothetical protein